MEVVRTLFAFARSSSAGGGFGDLCETQWIAPAAAAIPACTSIGILEQFKRIDTSIFMRLCFRRSKKVILLDQILKALRVLDLSGTLERRPYLTH